MLPVLERQKATKGPAAAVQFPDGQIIVGGTSPLLGACSTMFLDALEALAGIGPDVELLATETAESIQALEAKHLDSRNLRLHIDEVLTILSVSVIHSDFARRAPVELYNIRGYDARLTVILGSVDETILRSLRAYVTRESMFQTKRLYREH